MVDPQRFTTSRRAYPGIFGKDWSNFGDKDTFNVVEKTIYWYLINKTRRYYFYR